ncbi:MAG: prolyl oligopeptidase family serine peptidase, partial [Clostridia bacterium]|nr:prolyl oligopeptidase family serine peptidase [Clostridia bacterium]
MTGSVPGEITPGTKTALGFVNDNTLRLPGYGDIHFSIYIPKSYDGSEACALFVTLPGYEGLYFQGAGANVAEDFGPEAVKYNDRMIILSPQLNDWGETSARETVALTEYFIAHYSIDPDKVYLHGYSSGGETGSIVMALRPELYTAYLMTSSKWDGDISALTRAKTPVYLAVGEDDSYYGSSPMKKAYEDIAAAYRGAGLTEEETERLVVLDVKDQAYFTAAG